ncbi:response regulator [Sulfurimonas lithotrophica]|uniref:Sensory/regulatory protein RpfC n=1 Tax=Sulfurimonas lithotrophica TaxID=2590022 RepID=A0A5P8P0F6_9BACT|nr:ATP-binding protein [Sulfurimonas lithotrophica]QFR49179.1 response regulator [Sulfurimonas lithotrophica]
MSRFKLSIKLKVTLILVLLSIFFITILYLTINKIITNDILKIEHQKAEIILKTVEPTIAVNHFLELNKENKEFIKKLLENEDIMGICVHFNEKLFFMKMPDKDAELFRLEYPIKDVVSNEEIGTILLHYTKKHYNKTVKTLHTRFIVISILIIAVVILVYFIVQYMFKSLVKISEVIANYKIGDKIDFSHIKHEEETSKVITIISDLVKRINKHNHQMQLKQEELQEARENAEAASRFKSEFLANMSHEIRTPMNGVLGFVEKLSKSEKDPERLKQFKIIKNSGETLLSIINDILDLSKIETGKMELEYHPYNIKQLFDDTASIFTELISNKNITFKSNIDEKIPSCLLVDQLRLKQVVFNLLSNAVKFTSQNGTIRLDANIVNDTLHCSVIDSGVGIAKENQIKIFEAFGQEDTSTTRKFGGTGLGLSISYKLISMMGGKLNVKSQLDKGSEFYFDIPLHYCDEDTELDNNSIIDEEYSFNDVISSNAHILVVEDNKTNQLLLGMILEELGFTYDVANDGLESLELFKNNDYDIVLMDENMPNMNGIEATKKIRKIENKNSLKKTPIIAVTANALAEDRNRFLESGMDEYISKPYTEDDILKILRKFL